MSILEPLGSVIELASKLAAQKIVSGKMTKVEAFEYAEKLVQEMVETDEYKQAQQEVWNQFADVKDIRFVDKVEFKNG